MFFGNTFFDLDFSYFTKCFEIPIKIQLAQKWHQMSTKLSHKAQNSYVPRYRVRP